MSYYVMLNFEDPDPNAGAGAPNRFKGSNLGPSGAGGAAAGTATMYSRRAIGRSTTFKKREVVYYPCQEIIQADVAGTLARSDIDNIRRDCEEAKTIGVIIHGTPTDTDNGFGTDGGQVATWKELGRLMLLLLPDTRAYNVALIMCYAARVDNAELDHEGNIPATDLKTSFAYKFFRSICQLRRITMTARTGAVSTDAHLSHTVETEEQVMFVLEKQKAMKLRTANKAQMETDRDLLLQRKGVNKQTFDQILLKISNNPNQPTNGEVEDFAKQFVIYTPYMGQYIQNSFDSTKMGNRSKYGKLIYTYNGGVLEIIARYSTSAHGANYSLYRGALL